MDLVRGNNEGKIPNEDIWMFITQLPGSPIANKPQSYYTDEFGTLSKTLVTRICEDKFGAKKGHDGKNRFLAFDKNVLDRLADNYVPLKPIEITHPIKHTAHNPSNAFNTFWKRIEGNNLSISDSETSKFAEINQEIFSDEGKSAKNNVASDNLSTPVVDNTDKNSTEVLDLLKVLEGKNQVENKIKELGLFKRWPGSDTRGCPFCNDSGDKWYMLNHICKRNRKNAISF